MSYIASMMLMICLVACDRTEERYVLPLPSHFPEPKLPTDPPMTQATVELGRYLFYDTRLSVNGTTACANCHQQSRAFTDALPQAIGATGELHPRSAMSLVNIVYNNRLGWANHLLDTLEAQALVPMFGEAPIEMGLSGLEQNVLATLAQDALYQQLFQQAFPDDNAPFSVANIVRAIADFERTLISADASYDRYLQGDENAMSEAAKRGMILFLSERLECFHCHGGFNFTDSTDHVNSGVQVAAFHNTGLYNLDGRGAYPADNTGLYELTQQPEDMGHFKAPTLRNIAVTDPYMHDGSIKTLEEVVEHYARGGRHISAGEHQGDGAESPLKSEFVAGFILTETEQADLLAFLHSLTDETFLTNPAYSNPFE